MQAKRRLLIVAVTLAASGVAAAAEPTPPIKPGLWQTQSQQEVDGQKMPPPGMQLDKLPPEVRKQVEASMKSQGIDLGPGGAINICHSRESLQTSLWNDGSTHCKTEFTSRTATSWKWHSTCTQPDEYVADGETIFTDSEHYTVKTVMTTKVQGKPRTSRMTAKAQWLSADCGNLKPMQPAAK